MRGRDDVKLGGLTRAPPRPAQQAESKLLRHPRGQFLGQSKQNLPIRRHQARRDLGDFGEEQVLRSRDFLVFGQFLECLSWR